MPTPTLRDQRVVIIGGSSGIGFAVGQGALENGAHVVIGSSGAGHVEAAIERLGRGASGSAVDVKDEASVAAFAPDTLEPSLGAPNGAIYGASGSGAPTLRHSPHSDSIARLRCEWTARNAKH